MHIYRNAISNAIKYGKKHGTVTTEVVLTEDTLTLRIINLPGEGHEKVRQQLRFNNCVKSCFRA